MADLLHHLISYSTADAQEFANNLHNALEGGYPKISAWLDKQDLLATRKWDTQISEAIRDCKSLLFVMTVDSVVDNSGCYDEWSLALKYKKPVVPLLLKKCDAPFRLQSRQYIDFTGDFDAGIAKLRKHLEWLESPEGELQRMKDQLADAERDLRRAADAVETTRIQDEMSELRKSIVRQDEIVRNPKGAQQRTQESIERGLERERQPEKSVSGVHTSKFINPPPGIAPDYFQDRHEETKQVTNFLRHDAQRLITIVGRGGVGKTAMVCRLLKGLESGKLPDDLPLMPIDGIVYLSETGSRKANVANLFSDLGRLLPRETASELEGVYKNPQATTDSKVRRLLEAFPTGRYVLLLDNFEDLLDEQRKIKDAELDEALKTILNAPQHGIKVIITTRLAPRDLLLVHPERQRLPALELDSGLGSPYAENVLREMDTEGKLGLKNADDATLKNACERVRGYPRALEALVAVLAADRETTLEDILKVAEKQLPENVTQVLVGEAFNRLEPAAQKLMQALAAYGRPVPEVALDYLLQQYVTGANSAPILGRLVNMHFVRREGGRFYLHPVDRQYALLLLPKGEDSDRFEFGMPLFTQVALFYKGAAYFGSIRKPRAEWKTFEDLQPQLDEFDLRCAAEDWDTAARVLLDIDFNYLQLWGHYRLAVSLHERLLSKISDPSLKSRSLTNLGHALSDLGQVRKAISYYEVGLKLDHENHNRQAEGVSLGSLGLAYNNLGQTQKAVQYYEQALTIARDIGDKKSEGAHLGNLGLAYGNLGQIQKAIQYYEQALTIARDIGDKSGEGTRLGNLGLAYGNLGQTQKAIQYHEQALTIAHDIGDRTGEETRLGNLGKEYRNLGQMQKAIDLFEQALAIGREIGSRASEAYQLRSLGEICRDFGQMQKAIDLFEQALLIGREIGDRLVEAAIRRDIGYALNDQEKWAEAIQSFQQAIYIADEVNSPSIQNNSRWGLALAYFFSGDLKAAHETAEAASQYDVPLNTFNVFAAFGVITLRQGDVGAASAAFSEATAKANEILAQSAAYFDALDAKGTALCGLALCTGDAATIEQAKVAFRAARTITKAKGIVRRVLRLFDALAVADTNGMLKDVRGVVAGEE